MKNVSKLIKNYIKNNIFIIILVCHTMGSTFTLNTCHVGVHTDTAQLLQSTRKHCQKQKQTNFIPKNQKQSAMTSPATQPCLGELHRTPANEIT